MTSTSMLPRWTSCRARCSVSLQNPPPPPMRRVLLIVVSRAGEFWRALLREGAKAFADVLRLRHHRQHQLRVFPPRPDRHVTHGVEGDLAEADAGRRAVDDALQQPCELAVELGGGREMVDE